MYQTLINSCILPAFQMYVHWMTAPLIWNWSRKQATTCRLFSVKKRHAENVPDKLSEQEFWTRFFQSHYFHRDRIAFAKEDLFAECASSDDKGLTFFLIRSSYCSFVSYCSCFRDSAAVRASRGRSSHWSDVTWWRSSRWRLWQLSRRNINVNRV